MRKNTNIFIAFILFLFTACKKDFLDVNKDPNNAPDVTVDRLLPTCIGYTAYSIGNQFNVVGGFWAQYWTQGPTASQYEIYDQYQITSSTFNRPWDYSYNGPVADLDIIIDKGTKEGSKNYVAVAKIWKAYVMQLLTDLYGDIPLSEANKGDQGIINPKYDPQEKVYDQLIALIDEGLAQVDPAAIIHPGSDDLVYGGNMKSWVAFANTLKLKIYLRQVYVRPEVSKAGIAAMVSQKAPFITEMEQAEMKFFNAQFNKNPLNALLIFIGSGNILANNTSLNYLRTTEDPRLAVFFDPAANGQFVGINNGEGRLLPNPGSLSANNFSKPSPEVGGYRAEEKELGSNAPVIFISGAESYFLQAEAALRGFTGGNPQTLYNKGIDASFAYWSEKILSINEITKTELDSIQTQFRDSVVAFSKATSPEEKLEAIITQKWAAMTGNQNIEAWTEYRRTGYPSFLKVSLNSQIGNRFPARLLYPESETTRNPNTPPQKPIYEPMWWDVNK